LLSGGRRRVADDDGILARLERDSVRQALGNRSRAAWHVGAAALVLLLVLFVAWMAYQNTGATRVVPMPRAPVDMGPASATVVDPAPRWSMPLATSAPQLASDAAPAAAYDRGPTHLPPPLVLLERVAPPAKPAAAGPVVRGLPGRKDRNATMPPPTVAATHSAKANATTRPRQLAMDDVTADAPADPDVALLSAIIIHDGAHAAEKAQLEAAAACVRTIERRCARKTSSNP
jgi:hypothetical protein